MKAYGLCDIIENGPKEPHILLDDATLQQMKDHDNIVVNGLNAVNIIHSALSRVMFTIIMTFETAKEARDKLVKEF